MPLGGGFKPSHKFNIYKLLFIGEPVLSTLEYTGVNESTATTTVATQELSGTKNGHSVSFMPKQSFTISIPEEIPTVKAAPPAPLRKLPNRRGGFNQVLKMSDGMKLYLRTGEFSDGTLGEIFVDTQKEGTFARSMLNCFAVAISTGLQHGVPLSVFLDQFKTVMFEPKGPVSGSEVVQEATSIIDALFKELEADYPDGKAQKPAPVRAGLK